MLGILLFLLWLLLNGRITVEILLVGAAVSAALSWFTHKIFPGYYWLKNTGGWRVLPRAAGYLVYLVGQVAVSNIQVIRLILHPGDGRPKLVWFSPALKGERERLILANSITLTPGTVTAGLGEDMICVYALRPELARDLKKSGFLKRLQEWEEEDRG